MKTPIQLTGYWHFDFEENDVYPGNLTVDDDIVLKLLGCQKRPTDQFTIYGTTTDGKKITLSCCFVLSTQMSIPGIPQTEISAQYYFNGEHLDIESYKFEKAKIAFSDIHKWVNISGFESVDNSDNDYFQTKYKNPNPITFFKDENIEYSLSFFGIVPLGIPKHKLEINETTLIKIEHNNGFELNDFFDYLSQIKSFLTIAYFSEPGINYIKLLNSDTEIEFIFQGQFEDDIKEKRSKYDFLFLYSDIKDNFLHIFKTWINLNSVIGPVIDNLEESFRNRTILVENKFLNIIQAIETFHRRVKKNEKVSRETHKKRVKEILLSCPEEYNNWLRERLSFSNEPTLHERLHELFSEIDEELRNHLFKNWEKIIVDSKNSRNYYTHYDKSLEKKTLKSVQLHYLTQKLKIFLLIIVLRETGISDEELKNIIKNGSKRLFNHLINRE